jgi:hypothetical protein
MIIFFKELITSLVKVKTEGSGIWNASVPSNIASCVKLFEILDPK